MCKYHKDFQHAKELVECSNVREDEPKDEDDPRKLNIQQYKGYKAIQGPKLTSTMPEYLKPMKTTKVNIGMEENPKLAIIGDY